jgi:hypothetical protein
MFYCFFLKFIYEHQSEGEEFGHDAAPAIDHAQYAGAQQLRRSNTFSNTAWVTGIPGMPKHL